MAHDPAGLCRITFVHGGSVDVQGDVAAVGEELHRVVTRREHTFAMFESPEHGHIAVRPETVSELRAARSGP